MVGIYIITQLYNILRNAVCGGATRENISLFLIRYGANDSKQTDFHTTNTHIHTFEYDIALNAEQTVFLKFNCR